MPGYQQRLIIFALCIIVTYADTEINSFNALFGTDTDNPYSTVFVNHAQLWANVTDCPQTICVCEVKIDGIENDRRLLTFSKRLQNLGFVDISNLQPNTNYWFNLSCKGNQSSVSKTLNITTDYGRPSAPQNISVSLVAKRIQVTWSPPSMPDDSFNYYIITMDKNIIADNVSKNKTSYQINEEYEDGTKHMFSVAACYVNSQKETLCSNSTGTEVPFVIPVTITPPPTTTIKSIGVHSYSISVLMIIFSLFLISKMK